jgi:hypothetical protein
VLEFESAPGSTEAKLIIDVYDEDGDDGDKDDMLGKVTPPQPPPPPLSRSASKQKTKNKKNPMLIVMNIMSI